MRNEVLNQKKIGSAKAAVPRLGPPLPASAPCMQRAGPAQNRSPREVGYLWLACA